AQRQGRTLGCDSFLAVVTDGKIRNRARRIKEHVILAVISRRAQPSGQVVFRGKRNIQLEKSRIAQQFRAVFPSKLRQLCRRAQHEVFVARFVITRKTRAGDGFCRHRRAAVRKSHHRGYVKNMLIEPGKKECAVPPNRPSDGEPELLLAVAGLEVNKRMLRIQRTVAHEVKTGAVNGVGPRLGDYIDHRAARAAQLCAVGIRGDAKLLYHFITELIRRTVAAPRLCKETVVVISAVDQEAGLITAYTAECQIPARSRGQPPWILRYPRCKQCQVGETASVERQILNRTLIDRGRYRTRLRLDLRRRAGNRQRLPGACNRESKI